jgi:protein gp37
MHPDWARGLRDQCAAAHVPFFFKQWGEWIEFRQSGLFSYPPKCDTQEVEQFSMPSQCRTITLCKVGKKAAGRLLDGVLHDAYPVGAVTNA